MAPLVVLTFAPAARAAGAPASYSFSPSPITTSSAYVTLAVLDASQTAVGNAPVNLSFVPGALNSSATEVSTGRKLAPVPFQFNADRNGQIVIFFQSDTTQARPKSGSDTICAQSAPANTSPCTSPAGGFSASDSYTYGQKVYSFSSPLTSSPEKIADDGTLGPTSTPVCITLSDTGGPSDGVYLSDAVNGSDQNQPRFSLQDPGVTCSNADINAGTPITPVPTLHPANQNGQFIIMYQSSRAKPQPATGTDSITAADAASNPSVKASTGYTYGGNSYTFTFVPSPIGPVGSLGPGVQVNIKLTVTNPAVPAPYTVYLSFSGQQNSSASVNGSSINQLNSKFTTDSTGVLFISYKSANGPSAPPDKSQDIITAANAAAGPTYTVLDKYTYGTPGLVFTPAPIAPDGSLPPNLGIPVNLQAVDPSTGTTGVPGASVLVSFSQTSGGGSVSTGSGANPPNTPVLPNGPPVQTTADSNGNVQLVYKAPSTLPKTGSDTIKAQTSSSSTPVTDSYNFVIPVYTFSPSPIAPSGSLRPGQAKTVSLAITDSSGTPQKGATVYLGYLPAGTPGSASAGAIPLGSTVQPVQADSNGQVAITYVVPNPEPASGADQLVAQNAPSSPSVSAVDTFTFVPSGYWLVASDGGVFGFGSAANRFFGSTGDKSLNKPIVGMASTPSGRGYWLVASDGGIFAFGDAGFFGSTGAISLNKPIVGMAATPDGGGYWLVASDGGIFAFGNAAFSGSTGNVKLNKPIVGMASTPSGRGYWLVASDGGIFGFGDAGFLGSAGSTKLNQPVVGMASTPDGGGYWLVASDGGIFGFGDAAFQGSTGDIKLNKPVVGMTSTRDGGGYWLVASDGGIFGFGDAAFQGSTGDIKLNKPVVGMTAVNR